MMSQGNRMFSATALLHLPRYSGGGWEGDLLAEKTSMRSAPSPALPRKYRGRGNTSGNMRLPCMMGRLILEGGS
jgi:hypothetical protein